MKEKGIIKWFLLLVLTISVSACQEWDNGIDRNSTEALCSKMWVETYTTSDHYYCTHKLAFNPDGKGQEVFIYNNLDLNNKPLPTVAKTISYGFTWDWANDNMEGLIMIYGNNDVLYFDNVWVRNDYLSGKFNGENVTFNNANL